MNLAFYATKWNVKGYIIEERWNPNDELAKNYPNCHPNRDQKLYSITREYNERFVWDKTTKKFEYESSPSGRTDEFILNTRFILKDVMDIIIGFIERDEKK